jgi:lipopolysaccharide transport system ATP-binding protein
MDEVSRREGRTVLFVSHNLEAIRSLCSKGLLLQNGKMIFSGDINKTVSEYVSVFAIEQTEKKWENANGAG